MSRLHGLFIAAGAALCLALSACATTGQLPPSAPQPVEQIEIAAAIAAAPAADRAELLAAVTGEVTARFRCPATVLEQQLFFGARLAFDLLMRPKIQPESARLVDELRARTNAACGIVIVEAPPEGAAQPAPAAPTTR